MDIIKKFQEGKWMQKAKEFLNDKIKLQKLLANVQKYADKKRLSSVKETLLLMYDYLKDIASGKYKDYDIAKMTLIVAALVYVVTPIDIIPDIFPGGLIDDAAIAMWALKEANTEFEKYKAYKENATSMN
ncbi:YkvA family protein [Bacteroides sp.]|uniref:YkvA family protein n=1 Tax=Bacteroides sp. TaxID=29523 RepID=UPI0023C99724|nr:YkvA family protein [Bacteroides sp.]MDE6215378.1 DUF1232 domain-containing protein [Bacteroides sp.]